MLATHARHVTVIVAILAAGAYAADPGFTLVENGQPRATIVIADQPSGAAREAAQALQQNVQAMTGAQLPIESAGRWGGQGHAILVGASELAEKAGVRVNQDFLEGDHYVLRVRGDGICLVGNDAAHLRGSSYAVYDLLQRLGCGWYGTEPLWRVIPKRTTLVADAVDVDERPAFLDRHLSSLGGVDRSLRDAWRLGGWCIDHPHALDRLVPPEKYKAEHPDWFGKSQLCLSNPEVIELVSRQFSDRLANQPGLVTFSLSANDALGFCDCPRCRSIGNASALNLHFANAIARNLAKSYPNRFLLTFYAFYGTHDAPFPPLKAEPGVCVMQVNEGNHLHPWDEPERPDISQIIDRNNTRELIAFDGWKRTGATMAIYEWWIPTCNHEVYKVVPWCSGEVAMHNLRSWKQQDVRFLVYQTGDIDWTGLPLHWPLFYVGARGMWNPQLTARQIMTEACTKLYGPAAEPMRQFYETLEKATSDCTIPVKSWRLPSPERVYTPEIEAQAQARLDEAAAVQVDADVRARIDHERAMWQQARSAIAKLRVQPEEAKPSKQNPGM
jgi:hypothetical protein